MPSLREDQQPDAVIDLELGDGSSQRASTDEVVLDDDGLPELPPAPVFAHEPVPTDAPGATRRKRRVADLEEIATTNARSAREARAVALEQRRHLEGVLAAWRSAAAELVELRRERKGNASARAALVARERARAEQTARTDVAAELRLVQSDRDEMKTEIERLRVALTDQQSVNTDSTQRLREEQRQRGAAEKEAKRAIAAYETAERRLDAASEALHRSASDEQERIESIEAERAAAVAELEALGGGARLSELSNRIEDLVGQLGELDAEVVASRSRAEAAEDATALATARLVATEQGADEARADAARARERFDEITVERDALRTEVERLEEAGRDADTASAELEAALGAARADTDALRHETAALAAQLENAWAQVEEARRLTAVHAVEPGETAGTPADEEDTLLDALAELAADPVDDDEPADPDARFPPRPPDPEDPDARRAALGFLNSLASDLPPSRPGRT